jgi:hypothetical protein
MISDQLRRSGPIPTAFPRVLVCEQLVDRVARYRSSEATLEFAI